MILTYFCWDASVSSMLSGDTKTWKADAPWGQALKVVGISFLILAVLTAALAGLGNFADIGTVTIVYVIAVLFAAIRGGVVPAVITAIAAAGAAAFFFYPPLYDFRVYNPIHLIDLVLFIVVAVVTGKLANDVRRAKVREQADALREALIGSVSHELRTPLATIIGTASVLSQSSDIANHRRLAPLVKGLSEEADRLDDHIQNLLDATRISSEGIRPHVEWIDPADIINAAIERKSRLLTDHRVVVAVAHDLPMVQIDPMLVEKALSQLIENAAKYSPPGSPIAVSAEKGNGEVRLVVQDQGAGLSPGERDRIWQRFYRGEWHRATTKGSGLGLWVARSFVTACGGTIKASSAGPGQGATLSIHLPTQRAELGRRLDTDD